jgi:hypothetical protein
MCIYIKLYKYELWGAIQLFHEILVFGLYYSINLFNDMKPVSTLSFLYYTNTRLNINIK